MPQRYRNKLTAVVIRQTTKPGNYPDGGGLVLQVRSADAKSWIFRYRAPGGRIRELGLGSAAVVSLADARRKAQDAQRLRESGHDPLDVKRARVPLQSPIASGLTFQECAERYVATNAAGWRNKKHAAQWTATLTTYAFPVIGASNVADVAVHDVLTILEPIWATKIETATRVRQRIEAVLNWAKASGYRDGENPARWNGHLDQILPKPMAVRRSKPVRHHKALPAAHVPALMADLATRISGAAMALQFAALTAGRTGEVIGARWSEIDLDKRLWIIPGARMKAGVEHRVPLSDAAIDLLGKAQVKKVNDVVFCGQTPGRPLSNMAMLQLLKRMKRTDFVPHGLRATFRSWAAEEGHLPREVCEAALAHTVESDVERAYQRSDHLAQRRLLMDAWGRFATKTPVQS